MPPAARLFAAPKLCKRCGARADFHFGPPYQRADRGRTSACAEHRADAIQWHATQYHKPHGQKPGRGTAINDRAKADHPPER